MKNKYTYLVITPFFPSATNFVGSYILDQVKEIRKQTKFNLQVVKVSSFFSNEKDYHYLGFNVSVFRLIDFPFFVFPGLFNYINRIRFKQFLKIKGISEIKFAHAHVTYPGAYLLSDIKCKKIVQHHGLDVLQLSNGRNSIIKRIQRSYLIRRSIRQLNKVDLNVGVSKKVINQLLSFKNYKLSNEFVLYNGVDTKKFFPLRNNNKKNNNKIFTIGCVANFWKIKDQMTLIKSVKLLKERGKDIFVKFIGSGMTYKECKSFVDKNNLNSYIQFSKEIKHERLNNFYNQIDLFVLPSYYEALGCVYLESWATNTPFIAVKDQGIEELIPNDFKDRMLISRSNKSELSEKILGFYNKLSFYRFDKRYDIRNTIRDFLDQDIFYDK